MELLGLEESVGTAVKGRLECNNIGMCRGMIMIVLWGKSQSYMWTKQESVDDQTRCGRDRWERILGKDLDIREEDAQILGKMVWEGLWWVLGKSDHPQYRGQTWMMMMINGTLISTYYNVILILCEKKVLFHEQNILYILTMWFAVEKMKEVLLRSLKCFVKYVLFNYLKLCFLGCRGETHVVFWCFWWNLEEQIA